MGTILAFLVGLALPVAAYYVCEGLGYLAGLIVTWATRCGR